MFTTKRVSADDVRLMAKFTRHLAASCTTSATLRTLFPWPECIPYSNESLEKIGECTDYTPIPPTDMMLTNITQEVLRHCDIVSVPSEKWIHTTRDWITISRFQPLTAEFVETHKAHIVWSEVSRNQRVTTTFLLENKDYVEWDAVSRTINIWRRDPSELVIIEHLIDWSVVSKTNDCFSHKFVETFAEVLDWHVLSTSILEPATLTEFADYIDWTLYAQTHGYIDASLLRQLTQRICTRVESVRTEKWWTMATKNLLFTDEMLDEFANVVDWRVVARSKKYSPDTKQRFASRMWWRNQSFWK
jgi:hypothetical protein